MTFWALVASASAHVLVLLGAAETDAEALAAELVTWLIPVVGIVADYIAYRGRKRAVEPLQ